MRVNAVSQDWTTTHVPFTAGLTFRAAELDVLDARGSQFRSCDRDYPPLNAGITSRANQRSCSSNSPGDRPSAQWIM